MKYKKFIAIVLLLIIISPANIFAEETVQDINEVSNSYDSEAEEDYIDYNPYMDDNENQIIEEDLIDSDIINTEDLEVYDIPDYNFQDFESYNPYSDVDFNFDGYMDYDPTNPTNEKEEPKKPGDNFLKTGQTVQFLLKSEQKYPIYKDTGIKPVDGKIDLDSMKDIIRQIAISKNGKVIEDTDRSMILIDGKLIITGKNDLDAKNFIDKFNGTSVKVLIQDTRAGGKFNVVDYMEIMQRLVVKINDKKVILITDPIIDNSRALLPVRSIATELGANVTWDNEKKEAVVTKDDKRIVFKGNSDIVNVNNKNYLLTHKTQIHPVEMRMLSTIRLLVVELGGTMKWDTSNLELIINSL